MRAPDSSLYSLIRSLSKRERDNFVVWASAKGKEPKYLKLFFFIEGMKEVDEAVIKAHFPAGFFPKNFSSAKSNLFKALIRSIREMGIQRHSSISIEIEEVEIMIRKELFAPALIKASSGKEKAEMEERFAEWLRLSELEKRSLVFLVDPQAYHAYLDENAAKEAEIEVKLANLKGYKKLINGKYSLLKNTLYSSGKIDLETIYFLESCELLQSIDHARSERARHIFHSLWIGIHYFRQDHEDAAASTQTLVELFEQHAFLQNEFPKAFLLRLEDLSKYSFLAGNHAQGHALLERIQEMGRKHPEQFFQSQHSYWWCKLPLSGDRILPPFTEAEHEGVIAFLEKYEDLITAPYLIHHYLFLAFLFFWEGKYQQSQVWCNKILSRNWKQKNLVVLGTARLLSLMSAFGSGDIEAFENMRPSTLKFLLRNELSPDLSRTVISYLTNTLEQTPGFMPEAAKTELMELLKEPPSPNSIPIESYIDFKRWLRNSCPT